MLKFIVHKVPSYSLIVMVNNSKTFMVAILAQQLMKNGLMFGFSFSFMPPCPQCLLRSGTYISVWCHSDKIGLSHFLPNPGKGDPQFLKLWALWVYVLCVDKSPFQIFTLWSHLSILGNPVVSSWYRLCPRAKAPNDIVELNENKEFVDVCVLQYNQSNA